MIKKILVSVLVLTAFTAVSADAANNAAVKRKETPPPDYFPLRIKDSEGKPVEWWWKYTFTKCNMNGAAMDKKPVDFKVQVISAEKQSDETTLWQLDTSSPAMKTIHEWYMKPKGKVVWHKEQYGDDEKMQVQFVPERVLLMNPAKKDDTWSWKGKGNFGVEIDNVSTVSGPEEVATPAGKFQAIKVSVVGTQGGQPINMTYWYANYIGLVKSASRTANMESESQLADYSFKKPIK
ncbi:MAG: hypothetical protein IT342_26955 [Candidatus Melainabacteria bacterium]|nr:hypothetical protein [Candidatus Melainabacteria bacterium]